MKDKLQIIIQGERMLNTVQGVWLIATLEKQAILLPDNRKREVGCCNYSLVVLGMACRQFMIAEDNCEGDHHVSLAIATIAAVGICRLRRGRCRQETTAKAAPCLSTPALLQSCNMALPSAGSENCGRRHVALPGLLSPY